MASELYVETLKGLTSGANANKVIDPAGQTLYAPGHVIQVVNGTRTFVDVSSSSTTFVNTGDEITITPKFATSKILVVFNTSVHMNTANNSGSAQEIYLTIFRDSTNIGNGDYGVMFSRLYGDGALNHYADFPTSLEVFDTPNTTSPITYSARYRSVEGNETVGYAYRQHIRTFYAMEIAG